MQEEGPWTDLRKNFLKHQNRPPGKVGTTVKHREAAVRLEWLGEGPCEGWGAGLRDCGSWGINGTTQATSARAPCHVSPKPWLWEAEEPLSELHLG